MIKVSLIDKHVLKVFLERSAAFSTALSAVLIFVDVPTDLKPYGLAFFLGALVIGYAVTWIRSNNLRNINLSIEESTVNIKTGDIFKESGLKVIAFNEYFDTQVDNEVISENSLNGVFINKHLDIAAVELDKLIKNYTFEDFELAGENLARRNGKKDKYRLGTIFAYKDFLLTAFSKFDESNRAYLTMPEYLEFLINFWDRVNKVYAQRSVVTPIFGSGITRIKGHKNISDEDLLKIMLWTFRISEMRFKYPAKLTILIHESKIDRINLFEIESVRNGI